jgi:nicotinate dehydrogenase subunit B
MIPRREFLKTGGALVIGFSLRGVASAQRGTAAGPPDARQIDTWIAVHADNSATVYLGYAELGQGNSTALLQIAAEELDLDMTQVRSVGLDTNVTPNQGGTYSSASIARGGPQIRTAAAEARLALLQMASRELNAPVERLTVTRGVISNGQRTVSYGSLVGGKLFNLPFTGAAPVKAAADYKLVASSVTRRDTPDKVSGTYVYMQHMRLPGMLHGRVVRPRGQSAYGAGAKVLSVDAESIRAISGARMVRRGDFVGVVAENEWDAVRAAQQLKVSWDIKPSLPGTPKLYEQMRASATEDRVVSEKGDLESAFAQAPHKTSGRFFGPYQAHAPFAPNAAIADVSGDSALVICSTQDVYGTRRTLSRVLGMPQEKIRVQYYEGSGTYGHSCYDDVAQAAAILSRESGRPVRLQFMRWDEHGWDLFGPAHVGEVRAAADAQGKIVAYEYRGWQHNWSNVETSEQLIGAAPAEWPGAAAQQVNPLTLGGMYAIPNVRLVNHKLPALQYLRAAWLRSPLDLSFSFASEQAIDELAYRLGIDPYEFRKRNIANERWLGVLDAAAKAANWTPRKAASTLSDANVVAGRGIGLGTHLQSWGGAVAEIEVNKQTGEVRAKHMYGAIDAGLVVNPGIVESQIMGQLVQTVSRMLLEEVKFNETNVTTLDWNSYPVLRFEDCPEVTPVVVQRIGERSTGAGEEVMAAAAAAIGNAFFDATGVRMHEFPMTPERVLTALRAPRA